MTTSPNDFTTPEQRLAWAAVRLGYADLDQALLAQWGDGKDDVYSLYREYKSKGADGLTADEFRFVAWHLRVSVSWVVYGVTLFGRALPDQKTLSERAQKALFSTGVGIKAVREVLRLQHRDVFVRWTHMRLMKGMLSPVCDDAQLLDQVAITSFASAVGCRIEWLLTGEGEMKEKTSYPPCVWRPVSEGSST